VLNPTGRHKWHKTGEDEDSDGSNYSEDEGTQNAWVKHKRRSVTGAVSDEDYRSSQEEEDDEDGKMVIVSSCKDMERGHGNACLLY